MKETTMLKRTALILALGLAAGGCTHLATPSGSLNCPLPWPVEPNWLRYT